MKSLAIGMFTVFVLVGSSLTSSFAQDDFMALVTKHSDLKFDVNGATKIDHLAAFKHQEDGAVFIDVRRKAQYLTGHIPSAISLELKSELTEESLAQYVSKDQAVVFYCSDPQCYRSAHASAKALTWGYTNVFYFAGGWSRWVANGYPRESQ